MKQTIYNWALLCLLIITSVTLGAQTKAKCKRDFVIKTQITESTCMANGTIEVTLEGDLSEIEMGMTEYALRPVDGTEGTSLQFSKNHILRSIAAGTYIVSVRTFCIEDSQVGVVTESRNVVVGGNYKPLMAELDLARIRNPYANCETGLIAFNIQSGTGYGDLTFHLTTNGGAPQEITPIKGSILNGYVQYTLPGNYRSGNYQIDIYDSCSKATIAFTLAETTGMPNISGTFYPIGNAQSCNQTRLNSIPTPVDNGTNHYNRYFAAGLYQLAAVPRGQAPVESDWQDWTSSVVIFTLEGAYKDYFASNSLAIYIRVKDCGDPVAAYNTSIKAPTIYSSSIGYYCDHFKHSSTIYNGDHDGMWCYPIVVEAINDRTGQAVHQKTYTADDVKNMYSFSPYQNLEFPYDAGYTFRVTDASGYFHERKHSPQFAATVSFYTYNETYHCDTFKGTVQVNTSYYCYPVNLVVYKQNEQNNFEVYDTQTMNSNNLSVEYPYGTYKLEITIPNRITAAGTPYTYTSSAYVKQSTRPTSISLSSTTSASNSTALTNENYGYLNVTANQNYAANTRITVVDAPAGYQHIGRTFTFNPTSATRSFYIGNSTTGSSSSYIYMPTGNYTISMEDDCKKPEDPPITSTVFLETGFDAKNVKYIVEEDGCNGAYIKLDTQEGGYVKYNGTPNYNYTNFKIISGPSGGYETTLKRYNEKLQIVADGEYTIGTVINSGTSYQSYYIRRDVIKFVKSKPVLKASVTSAYVCTDPGSTLGYMIFTGQGGQAPYSYKLLKADGSPTGLTATGGEDERVVFNYGLAGETYIVEISDACGNSTTQEMTLADLKTQSIIYSIPPTGDYCTGDEIKLNCITLGQTSYLWEKKVSEGVYEFVSNEQNPRITPATADDSGTYRVTVTPEYCGEAITGEVVIKVYPPLAAGAMSPNQEICVATRASAMSCNVTGGKGDYNYQWQMSEDQTIWSNVANATASTLAPLHTKSGTYYYRLQITDDCTTVSSSPITLEVKPCYIMVNPNIRSIAK